MVFLSEKEADRLPYAIVQACMKDRHEAKVVCWNMNPLYVASIATQKIGSCFSKHPHDALFSFVRSALRRLKHVQPQSILDGLVRVDVFLSMGGFVVNEFESLEANFCSKKHENEMQVKLFLLQYWKLQLSKHVF